jgi:hypothetical protein
MVEVISHSTRKSLNSIISMLSKMHHRGSKVIPPWSGFIQMTMNPLQRIPCCHMLFCRVSHPKMVDAP